MRSVKLHRNNTNLISSRKLLQPNQKAPILSKWFKLHKSEARTLLKAPKQQARSSKTRLVKRIHNWESLLLTYLSVRNHPSNLIEHLSTNLEWIVLMSCSNSNHVSVTIWSMTVFHILATTLNGGVKEGKCSVNNTRLHLELSWKIWWSPVNLTTGLRLSTKLNSSKLSHLQWEQLQLCMELPIPLNHLLKIMVRFNTNLQPFKSGLSKWNLWWDKLRAWEGSQPCQWWWILPSQLNNIPTLSQDRIFVNLRSMTFPQTGTILKAVQVL